jgi:NitT/TauT family transport system substrate-binding protein
MTISLRKVVAGGVAAIAAVALAGCSSSKAGNTSNASGCHEVKIKSADPSLTSAATLTVAAKALDKAHGVCVKLDASGTSSTNIIDAVLAGQAEFGTPGTATALDAIREGAKLQIIGAIANDLHTMVISNKALAKTGLTDSSPIADRVRALKGMTIATGAVGSTHFQILRAYLKQYGLDPDKDVRIVGVSASSALITGIEHGQYGAIANASGVVEKAVADKAGSIWISGPRGDIPGSQDVKTCVLVARTDTVQNKSSDVDAVRAAVGDALNAINNDHDATGTTLRAAYFPKLDTAVWDLAWGAATAAYPKSLRFPQSAYQYWIDNDAKGAASFSKVSYTQITYGPAQTS